MGEEDVVVIPIQVEVQDSASTTEYLAKLKAHLEQIKQTMSADNKGNDMLKQTQEEAKMAIANIEELGRKLGEVMKSAADSNAGTKDMFKLYSDMKRGLGEYKNVSQEQIDTQKEMWLTMKNANAEEQASAQETANVITSEIDKEIASLQELARSYMIAAKYANQSGAVRQAQVLGGPEAGRNSIYNNTDRPFQAQAVIEAVNMENQAQQELEQTLQEIGQTVTEITKAEQEAAKEAARAAKEQEAATRREIAAVKQSAGQYYYKLRAVKMFGFVINNLNSSMDNFGKKMISTAKKGINAYLKLIPGVTALRKAFDGASNSQKKFNRELGKTSKSHDDFNESLGRAVKNFLRYGLGIRSLFVLFNRLRHTMIDGLGQLSQKYSEVNQQMSSVVSSMNQMKAAVTSVVQPLLNVLAPALERVAAIVADIAYKVASFIAALTGQSFVFKATRQQVDYAKSLDKTAKAAKEANKELGKYDKLNVIQQNKNGGNDDGGVGAMGFEKVPVDSKMADLANKFKKFLNRLLGPIKKAWEKMKDFVKKGWKYAFDELLKLAKDVARDFWRVWEEPETQKIFENLFKVLGDIGFIVGNLAKNFRAAWNENENGYRILRAIRDVLLIISEGAVQIADYMVEWSESLSFIPLMNALADNMEQKLVPAVQKVVDLLVYVVNELILKVVKDFIESGLPQIIRIAGNLVEAIGNIAENLRTALKDSDRGVTILTKIEDLFQIVADHVESASEKTAEWAKNLDFVPLLDSISSFLDNIKPAVDFIADTLEKLWESVILPFQKYLIEEGLPKLLDMLGDLAKRVDWEDLKAKVGEFLETFEKFLELAWETFIEVVRKLGEKLTDFLKSETLQKLIDLFKDWVENADPEDLANKLIILGEAFLGVKGAIAAANKIIGIWVGIMTAVNLYIQTKMIKTVGELTAALGGEAVAGGGTAAAGGGGLAGAFATLGTSLAIVAGLLADIGAAMEIFRLGKLKKLQDDLPQTADATNGMTKEMNGLEKIFKKVWEIFHPGQSLGDEIIVESDYEKLENMKDELVHMGSAMENAGTLSKDAGQKISDAMDIFAEHDERIEDLSDEEVKRFTEMYESVEKYYNKVKDNKGPIDAIDRLEGHWWDLKESAPTEEDGAEQATRYISGYASTIEESTEFENSGHYMIAGTAKGAEAELEATDTTSWWQKILKSFTDFFKIHSPSVVMEEEGVFVMQGLFNGIAKFIPNIIKEITSFGKTILDTLKSSWKSMISETQRAWATLKSNVVTYARDVVNKFRTEFSATKLISIGKNFIGGLIDGIKQKASSLMSTISDVCSDAVNAVKSAFQIHSPSRVMRAIGQYIIEGLALGVEDEAENDLIPIDFMDTFLDALTSMSLDAVDIVTNMVDELNDKFANLAYMERFSSQLNKISSIKVPDIAVGGVLPSTTEFRRTNNSLDEKTLRRIIGDVVGDIVDKLNSDSNKEPIMLQLDSRTVAEAVWDEEEKRYKQRGDYRPFYT